MQNLLVATWVIKADPLGLNVVYIQAKWKLMKSSAWIPIILLKTPKIPKSVGNKREGNENIWNPRSRNP